MTTMRRFQASRLRLWFHHPATFRLLDSVTRFVREPLLQFLLIGVALFAGYRALNPQPGRPTNSTRIEITDDDLRQLDVAWVAQWQRHPTTEEIRRLVEGKVREEILYREALALGLDRGDTIVKRRLAQKLEFLAEDLTRIRDPQPDELKAWFDMKREHFALPPRVSFRHLYFSLDRGGERAKAAAVAARERLTGKPAGLPVAAGLSDSFMFQDHYGNRTPAQVAEVFGTTFASAVFELTPGSWQGPIESGFGWHLIWVDSVTPGRVPAFEEIEPDVKSRWIDEQRAESRRRAFDTMKARYEVVLPKAPTMNGTTASATAGQGAP